MDNSKRLLRPYMIILGVALLATVTLRSVACFIGLDYGSGYFTNNSLSSASAITVVVFCLLLFTYVIFATQGKFRADFTTPHTYVPTGICGAALLFFGVELLFEVKFSSFFDDLETLFKTPEGFKDYVPETSIHDVLLLICGILAILAIIHFFLNAHLTENHSTKRAAYSLTTVMFLALYAAVLYFDSKLPINAPNKLTDQMAFLFASVFFLYESRISLGREKWKGYVTFGLIATLLAAYSSIPALLVYLVKGKVISASVSENALMLAIAIFSFSRLALVNRLYPEQKNQIVESLRIIAKERDATVTALDAENAPDEVEKNQLSIDDILVMEDTVEIETEAESREEEPQEKEDSAHATDKSGKGEEAVENTNQIAIESYSEAEQTNFDEEAEKDEENTGN